MNKIFKASIFYLGMINCSYGQGCPIIELPSDIYIAPNQHVPLPAKINHAYTSARWHPSTGLNDAHTLNPYVSLANGSQTYTLTINSPSSHTTLTQSLIYGELFTKRNLIKNANFSKGSNDFQSDYVALPDLALDGSYHVVSPNGKSTGNYNRSYWHRLGFGGVAGYPASIGMLLARGDNKAGKKVWYQNISGIQAGKRYLFSACLLSCDSSTLINLDLYINGEPIVKNLQSIKSYIWDSDRTGTIEIAIVNQNTRGTNDFNIDHLVFAEICPGIYERNTSVHVVSIAATAVTCNQPNGKLTFHSLPSNEHFKVHYLLDGTRHSASMESDHTGKAVLECLVPGSYHKLSVVGTSMHNTVDFGPMVLANDLNDCAITLVVPNAFTPNGDGYNDYFRPLIINGKIHYYDIKIYNRWGIQVYASNDPERAWDGCHQGAIQYTDGYAWVIRYRDGFNKMHVKTGFVTVLR